MGANDNTIRQYIETILNKGNTILEDLNTKLTHTADIRRNLENRNLTFEEQAFLNHLTTRDNLFQNIQNNELTCEICNRSLNLYADPNNTILFNFNIGQEKNVHIHLLDTDLLRNDLITIRELLSARMAEYLAWIRNCEENFVRNFKRLSPNESLREIDSAVKKLEQSVKITRDAIKNFTTLFQDKINAIFKLIGTYNIVRHNVGMLKEDVRIMDEANTSISKSIIEIAAKQQAQLTSALRYRKTSINTESMIHKIMLELLNIVQLVNNDRIPINDKYDTHDLNDIVTQISNLYNIMNYDKNNSFKAVRLEIAKKFQSSKANVRKAPLPMPDVNAEIHKRQTKLQNHIRENKCSLDAPPRTDQNRNDDDDDDDNESQANLVEMVETNQSLATSHSDSTNASILDHTNMSLPGGPPSVSYSMPDSPLSNLASNLDEPSQQPQPQSQQQPQPTTSTNVNNQFPGTSQSSQSRTSRKSIVSKKVSPYEKPSSKTATRGRLTSDRSRLEVIMENEGPGTSNVEQENALLIASSPPAQVPLSTQNTNTEIDDENAVLVPPSTSLEQNKIITTTTTMPTTTSSLSSLSSTTPQPSLSFAGIFSKMGQSQINDYVEPTTSKNVQPLSVELEIADNYPTAVTETEATFETEAEIEHHQQQQQQQITSPRATIPTDVEINYIDMKRPMYGTISYISDDYYTKRFYNMYKSLDLKNDFLTCQNFIESIHFEDLDYYNIQEDRLDTMFVQPDWSLLEEEDSSREAKYIIYQMQLLRYIHNTYFKTLRFTEILCRNENSEYLIEYDRELHQMAFLKDINYLGFIDQNINIVQYLYFYYQQQVHQQRENFKKLYSDLKEKENRNDLENDYILLYDYNETYNFYFFRLLIYYLYHYLTRSSIVLLSHFYKFFKVLNGDLENESIDTFDYTILVLQTITCSLDVSHYIRHYLKFSDSYYMRQFYFNNILHSIEYYSFIARNHIVNVPPFVYCYHLQDTVYRILQTVDNTVGKDYLQMSIRTKSIQDYYTQVFEDKKIKFHENKGKLEFINNQKKFALEEAADEVLRFDLYQDPDKKMLLDLCKYYVKIYSYIHLFIITILTYRIFSFPGTNAKLKLDQNEIQEIFFCKPFIYERLYRAIPESKTLCLRRLLRKYLIIDEIKETEYLVRGLVKLYVESEDEMDDYVIPFSKLEEGLADCEKNKIPIVSSKYIYAFLALDYIATIPPTDLKYKLYYSSRQKCKKLYKKYRNIVSKNSFNVEFARSIFRSLQSTSSSSSNDQMNE